MKTFITVQIDEKGDADVEKRDKGVPIVGEEVGEGSNLGCTCPSGVREGVLSGEPCALCRDQLEREDIPY